MWLVLGVLCFVNLTCGGVVRLVLAPRPPADYSSVHLTDLPKYRGGVLQTTKPPVTFHDYRYAQPNQAIVRHIQRVLDRLAALRESVHPRIRRLYDMLKKDMLNNYPNGYAGELYSITDLLDAHPSKMPQKPYDVNKINRIYSMERNR